MSQPETIASAKDEAKKKSSSKKRGAQLGVGAAVLGAAAAAVVTGVVKRRRKSFDEVIVPESVSSMDRGKVAVVAAATRRAMQKIVDNSLTPEDAASLLKIGGATVNRRIIGRSLYAFRAAERWLLPKFQFQGPRLVKNIEKVLPHLDADLDPLEVVNWFSYPHVDLIIGDASVSPVEWLETGCDAGVVADLVDELGSGL